MSYEISIDNPGDDSDIKIVNKHLSKIFTQIKESYNKIIDRINKQPNDIADDKICKIITYLNDLQYLHNEESLDHEQFDNIKTHMLKRFIDDNSTVAHYPIFDRNNAKMYFIYTMLLVIMMDV